jgi:hypothetical protein
MLIKHVYFRTARHKVTAIQKNIVLNMEYTSVYGYTICVKVFHDT